jgi:hypothetical protein
VNFAAEIVETTVGVGAGFLRKCLDTINQQACPPVPPLLLFEIYKKVLAVETAYFAPKRSV